MDLSGEQDYPRLAQILRDRNADTVVMYLATAPALFTTVCEQLAAVGLNTANTRIVLEKPLGHDLASNRAINQTVCGIFSERQVFRIDHYLGKPAVQNLFALRFGNALFEPLWRREHIANIQITIAEELGVEKRGAFYDTTGALRDMVQNHALQLLCAMGMEPPINSHADAIRDEKLKVLRSLRPWTPANLVSDAIRGQYGPGKIDGTAFRLMGAGVSALGPGSQADDTDMLDRRSAHAERAIDDLRRKFGSAAVIRGIAYDGPDKAR